MTDPAFVFTDRARPVVQIGLGDRRIDGPEAALWDVATWDDPGSLWAGVQPLWLDISCYVHDESHTYGRRWATGEFEPGTASLVVENPDGWADPIPPEGDPAILTLRAGRAIRIGIDHDVFGLVWRWRGYIDDTGPRYDPTRGDVVDIKATCALGEAGRGDVPEVAVAVGAGELVAARVNRILNGVKWPAELRDVAPSSVAVTATTLGDEASNLLQIAAESAGGAVFGDTEGRVAFRGRDWQVWDVDEDPDGIIGNMGGDDPFVKVAAGLYTLDPADLLTETAPGSGLYEWGGG